MKFNVTFKENNEKIDLCFKEISVVSDGGFERGYAQGKAQGELDGYIKGNSDGHQLGLLQGFENAKTKLGEIEITENGEYSPNSDIIGFNNVKVNVVPKSKLTSFLQGTEEYTITQEDLAGLTSLRQYAFQYCRKAVRIELPSTLKTINKYAFANCYDVKEFYYNAKQLNDIDQHAYVFQNAFASGCTFIFGNEVEYIPKYLFRLSSSSYYINVAKLVIGENVKTIAQNAFEQLTRLKEIYYNAINATVGINSWGNTGVKLVIGNKVNVIPSSAFDSNRSDSYGNTSITVLEFEENCQLETINYAVFWCENVTSAIIPASVKTIDSYGLRLGNSSAKATIRFLSVEPPTIKRYTFNDSATEKIIVPKGTLEAYKNATNWAYFADYLEEATE